jgi:hypothetical protein
MYFIMSLFISEHTREIKREEENDTDYFYRTRIYKESTHEKKRKQLEFITVR